MTIVSKSYFGYFFFGILGIVIIPFRKCYGVTFSERYIHHPRRKIDILCMQIVARWQHVSVWSAYNAWHRQAAKSSYVRKVCRNLLSRWQNGAKSRAFYSWLERARYQHKLEDACCNILSRWQNGDKSRAFYSWLERACYQRKMEDVCCNILSRWQHGAKSRAFYSWPEWMRYQRKMEDICRQIVWKWLKLGMYVIVLAQNCSIMSHTRECLHAHEHASLTNLYNMKYFFSLALSCCL